MEVLCPAYVDFCVKYVACLGLTKQETLDVTSDQLFAYLLLDGKVGFGGEAELLAGAVVAAKERENFIQHGSHFVNLVGLVHGLICLIDQVQEVPEGDEAVTFHDFPETGGHSIKLWPTLCPLPWLDHTLLHLKPQTEECFSLGTGLKVLV